MSDGHPEAEARGHFPSSFVPPWPQWSVAQFKFSELGNSGLVPKATSQLTTEQPSTNETAIAPSGSTEMPLLFLSLTSGHPVCLPSFPSPSLPPCSFPSSSLPSLSSSQYLNLEGWGPYFPLYCREHILTTSMASISESLSHLGMGASL